jgi:hypothetical protein
MSQERYLPWGISNNRLPCQVWHPEDLWETGCLTNALFNELSGIEDEEPGDLHKAEYCLEHILHCWNSNMKRLESAGPSFLIHVLKGRYEGIGYLEDENARLVDALRSACDRTNSFQVLLARLYRTAHGHYPMPAKRKAAGGAAQMMRVIGTDCFLKNIISDVMKDVKIFPLITEVDFVNEDHFEDDAPDVCNCRNGRGEDYWV